MERFEVVLAHNSDAAMRHHLLVPKKKSDDQAGWLVMSESHIWSDVLSRSHES